MKKNYIKRMFCVIWNRTIAKLINRFYMKNLNEDYYFWEITDDGEIKRI